MPRLTAARRLTVGFATASVAALLFAGCSATPATDGDRTKSPKASSSTAPSDDAAGGNDAGGDAGDTDSGSADASGQTPDEACTIMIDALGELSAIQTDDLTSDPAAALGALDTAQATIVDAASQVTNPEIQPAAQGAADATVEYFDFVRTLATAPESADVAALGDKVQVFIEQVGEVQTVCTA